MDDATQTFRQVEAVFLRGLTHTSPASPSWEQVADLKMALDLATSQCLEGYEDWCGLRELQASKSLGKAHRVEGGSRTLDVIWELAGDTTIPALNVEVENEVGADLRWCVRELLFESQAREFFNLILELKLTSPEKQDLVPFLRAL